LERNRIALIVHDGKKAEMVEFLNKNKQLLNILAWLQQELPGNMFRQQG